jgi:hypothetical protein
VAGIVFGASQLFSFFYFSRSAGLDFGMYYLAAAALRDGLNPYTLSDWGNIARQYSVTSYALPYRYPPLTSWLIEPFTFFPFSHAFALWTILNIVAYSISILILSKVVRDTWVDSLFLLSSACFVPVFWNYSLGQINALVLLGIVAWVYFANKEKKEFSFLGGLSLAFGVALKPVPFLLCIYVVWKRKYWQSLGLVVGLIISGILPMLTGDPGFLIAYLKNILTLSTVYPAENPTSYPSNQSILGFTMRLLSKNAYGPSLVNDPLLAVGMAFGISLALFLATFIVLLKRRTNNRSAVEVGFLLVLTVLALPGVIWYHDIVLNVISYAVAWQFSRRLLVRAVLTVSYVSVLLQGLILVWQQFVGITVLLSLGTYGLLVLWLLIWRELSKKAG